MNSANFIQAMVMVRYPDEEHWKGMGSKSFRVMPRIGEHIAGDDENGVSQIYRVVGVHHPLEPTVTAGDIFVVHVGDVLDEMNRLFNETQA